MINLSDLTNLIVNIVRRELLRAKFGAGGGPVFPPSVEIGGTAGGDLTGTYPDPVVAKIRSVLVSAAAATPADGDILKYSATSDYWYPTSEYGGGGDVSGSGSERVWFGT